jgi:hypothetical protein
MIAIGGGVRVGSVMELDPVNRERSVLYVDLLDAFFVLVVFDLKMRRRSQNM